MPACWVLAKLPRVLFFATPEVSLYSLRDFYVRICFIYKEIHVHINSFLLGRFKSRMSTLWCKRTHWYEQKHWAPFLKEFLNSSNEERKTQWNKEATEYFQKSFKRVKEHLMLHTHTQNPGIYTGMLKCIISKQNPIRLQIN